MKIPKYIEQKLKKRRTYQEKANILTSEIDEWLTRNKVDTEYTISHICLFTEPGMVELEIKQSIKEK